MPYGIMINCTAVLIGGLMGAFLKDYFPDKLKESLPGIFGLSAITMGVTLIIRLESLSAVILAVIIGTPEPGNKPDARTSRPGIQASPESG